MRRSSILASASSKSTKKGVGTQRVRDEQTKLNHNRLVPKDELGLSYLACTAPGQSWNLCSGTSCSHRDAAGGAMAYPSNRGQHSSRDTRRVDGGKVRYGASLAAADAFRSSPPHIHVLGELEQSQSSQTRKDRQNSLEHGQESFLPRKVSILMKNVVVVARRKLNFADGRLASK